MNTYKVGMKALAITAISFSFPVMAQQVVTVPTQNDVQVNPQSTTETVILRRKKVNQPQVQQTVPTVTIAKPVTQVPAQTTVYNQPKTVVVASPIEKSKADQLRNARQRAEIETEQKIVEKLETSRLADEKLRAAKLFGNKLDPAASAPVAAAVKQAVEQRPVVVQPQVKTIETVIIPQKRQTVNTDAIKSDIYKSVKSDLAAEKAALEAEKSQGGYFAGTIGTAEYSQAYNVANNHSMGFSFGSKVDDMLWIEGTFNYSNFYIEESVWLYKEMDQYNIGVTAKYSFLPGKIQPFIGGVASYTYRKYRDLTGWGYQYTSPEVTSQAFDLGGTFGVDLVLSKKLAIGIDYKYLMNITSRDDFSSPYKSFYNSRSYGYVQPIESMDYQIMGLSAKILF